MLRDATNITADELIECDVCIIGAGAAGLTIASEFLGSSRKVVVLEAGGEKPSADSQSFYKGDVTSPIHPSPDMYRQRRLGGSSTIWGGRCVPFDPIDFEARDWVPLSGWPFGRATLDPYYERAQHVLDAGGFDYSAASALAPGALLEGFEDPRISTDTIERFSLPTDLWKSWREKLIAAPDIHIVYNAACVGLRSLEHGAAVEVAEAASPDGKRFKVRAREYVVASGGIETVRILGTGGPNLMALGNDGDMLGRTYMCHLELGTGTLRITPQDRPVSYGFEFTRDGVYARRRFTLTAERQRELQVMNVMARLHHASVVDPAHRDPILSLMYVAKNTVIPEYRRKLSMIEHAAAGGLDHDMRFWSQHGWNILRGSPQAAAFITTWVTKRILSRRKLPYVALHNRAGLYAIDMNIEQAPNLDSRITLSDQLDRHNVPRVKIDWRITDLDVKTAIAGYADLDSALRATGRGRIEYGVDRIEEIARNSAPVGGHHMGTARMSTNPKQGVVDADCRVHGVGNLHVAGAAVLPTSSHANPTLTLVALAIRLSDRLKGLSGKLS